MDDQIAAAIREHVQEGMLRCVAAFHIVKELDVTPLAVGETADALEVRLSRCQLGLFGYGDQKSIVEPAEEVSPELERAVREGLVKGRLPCAVVWDIAAQFEMPKLHVANAAEKLQVRIKPCQLGAF
ncbi:MAG: hypothetical protein V3S14_10025 [Anaerolineae bacterium]